MNNLPPQRLALTVPRTRQLSGRDFALFVDRMRALKVNQDAPVSVEILGDGTLKFHVPVPDQNPPKKSSHRQRVEAQIKSRRDKIAKGEEVPGYMPPVKPKRVVRIARKSKDKKTTRSARSRAEGSKDE